MPITKGWRTSEFWLTLAGVALPLINTTVGLNLDTNSILGIAGALSAYILSRGYVKGKSQ